MNQPKTLDKRPGASSNTTEKPGVAHAGIAQEQLDFGVVAVRIMDAIEHLAFLQEQRALKDKVITEDDLLYSDDEG